MILTAHHDWPNVVAAFGPRFGRLDLLLIPPYTEPTHAYNLMMAATSLDDTSTPDQLLGIASRGGNRLFCPVALERWESDGGAPAPPAQPQMHDA
ncbi:hypothetical protein [Mycolicibacterium sp.]|uniref:hypothetical protein n=1 Tax=Mycolicibacterium sp. TaxID=2320850 RepID=UPI0037C93AF4